ncbi:MAG: M36 family metallopeptidase, partial [Planctomycetota bacterium]|nr:M36 family metallopeptidase [Planctomycetota bacterium]
MRDRRMTRTGLGMAVAVLIAGSAAGQTGDGREGLEAGAETPRRGVVGFGGALPNFDVRFDDAAAVAAVRTALAGERQRRREVAAAELERAIGGARVDFDAALGTPAFVRSTERLLTEAAPGVTARQASRAFVLNRADLFGLAAAQLDSARISREATSSNNGVTSLWRAQRVGGVEVLGAELRANVTADGRIVSVASTMLGEPEGGFQIAERRLSREDAVRIAAGNVGIDLRGPLTARAAEADERGRLAFARTPEVQMDILTREALFPLTAVMLRPVWEVVVAPAASADAYEVLVDANDGRVLRRINRTVYEGMVPATYRVFTGDSPAPFTPGPDSPNGAQGTPVSRESVSLISMDPVASPEGWIPDGSNETLGNNVNAFLDANNDDMPDGPRPMGSPARVFDFPLDLGMVPETYGDAAVTQVFYWSNWFHDRMYGLGFTETFDNFQTDNFGRGGVGGDPIRAEVQDGGDTNNANFLTFQDGSAARMQMYLWPGPSPDRDGAFDTQIVIHELMHGVSIRLLDLIDTLQSRGMGEGWSDFFGLTLLAEATDDPHGVYALSGYATFEGDPGFDDNYYFGVRRYPYSTDLMKNPLTFKDIDDNQFVLNPAIPINPAFGSAVPSQVHNIGQVWCSMLLECRANLWDAQGFAANETMMQLVIDGLKLSPRNPNFIQARDAIL